MYTLTRKELQTVNDIIYKNFRDDLHEPENEDIAVILAILADCIHDKVSVINITEGDEIPPVRDRRSPYEKIRSQVYATGNRHQIENFEAVHGRR